MLIIMASYRFRDTDSQLVIVFGNTVEIVCQAKIKQNKIGMKVCKQDLSKFESIILIQKLWNGFAYYLTYM